MSPLKKSLGHLVPKALQESQQSAASKSVEAQKIFRLSHAEKAKTLLAGQKTGVLSTSSVEGGFPFGSIINYALDMNENIFFFASTLAEHTNNLSKDSRASLFVSESKGEQDQLAVARATILGNLHRVEKTSELIQTFKLRHPTALYVHFDDFYVYQFSTLHRVRYIAGFGEMSWVNGDVFESARADRIALNSLHAVDHMNADHADANVLLVNRYSRTVTDATSATMLVVDAWGMDFLTLTPSGKKLARVPFESKIVDAKDVKTVIVQMTKAARL